MSFFARRTYVGLVVILLCISPFLLNLFGVNFSALPASNLPLSTDDPFANGKMLHALMEWVAVTIAILAGGVSLSHYRVYKDIGVAVVGIAIFFSGLVDGVHIAVASGLIATNSSVDAVIPFTWAFSRIFVASALLLAIAISMSYQKVNENKGNKNDVKIISVEVLVLSITMLVMVVYVVTANEIPTFIYKNALIVRPFDVLPLALLCCSVALTGGWWRGRHSIVQFYLILSIIPQIVAQVHMALGSGALFDNDFNIGHGLKILSYFLYFVGVMLGFVDRGSQVQKLPKQAKNIVDISLGSESKALLEVGSPTISMAIRMPAITFLVSLTVALVVGGVFYLDAEKLVTQRYVEELQRESKLIEPLLSEQFSRASSDAIFLSRTPPIQGIVSAVKNNNSEEYHLWVNRLQQIFKERLGSNPNYLQLQYLEINRSVKEVVSVSQSIWGVRITPEAKLEDNIEKFYVSKITEKNRGEIYLSPVDEYRVAGEEQTVIHVGTPIYDADTGWLYGVVVVHVDLAIFVRQIVATTLSDYIFYLANYDGNIIFLGDRGVVRGSSDKNTGLYDLFPEFASVADLEKNHGYLELVDKYDNQFSSYLQSIQLKKYGADKPILFLLQKPTQVVDLQLTEFRNRSLIVGFALSVLALAIAVLGSRRFVADISAMSGAVQNYEATGKLVDIPIQAKDEIGVLARSFSNLLTRMDEALIEQKLLADQALSASSRLAALVDNAVDAIITINALGEILSFNRAAVNMFDLEESEVIGKNVSCLMPEFHARQHDQYINNYLRTTETKIIGKGRELIAKKSTGEEFQIHLGVSRIETNEGILFSGIIRDISEKKRLEESQERNLILLESTLNSTENGILVTAQDNTVMQINNRFVELWGLPSEMAQAEDGDEILKSVLSQLKTPKEFSDLVKKLKKSNDEIQNKPFELINERVLNCASRTMTIGGSFAGRVWSISDVTQSKNIEKNLIKAKEDAEQVARYKSEFLASMSHEIRTPMNGVLGMLNLVLRSPLNKEQEHQLNIAQASAESLLTVINDILDFSKVEAGRLELEYLDFDLIKELGGFIESMATRAQEKSLELILDVSNINHAMVNGDPARIRQVLNNLVGNAIKFTRRGEVVIKAELVEQDGDQLHLHCGVSDTGIGIPPEKLASIFESFTQVDASTTRQFGGTGLGLAIAKQLCELMGGDISASSELGVGSCFEFSLQLQRCTDSIEVPNQINIADTKILIVDDNPANCTALRKQLERWGAKVSDVNTAQSGVEILEQHYADNSCAFDIVFLDMSVVKTAELKINEILTSDSRFAATKVILMTPLGYKADTDNSESINCDAHFSKPATLSDLFDVLATVMLRDDIRTKTRRSAGLSDNHADNYADSHARISRQQPLGELKTQHWPTATRILLVEDNLVNQEVARGLLKEFALYCDVAENGMEALSILSKASSAAPYTLVLMDCQMPIMDGYEATRQIRAGAAGENNINVIILAMTANAMKGDREKCLAAGMNDYLTKPINYRELLIKLQSSLGVEMNNAMEELVEDDDDSKDDSINDGLNLSWDLRSALSRVRGKHERLATLLDMFLTDMPNRFKLLEQAITQQNYDEITSIAHTVKGVCGNLSANSLMSSADKIEQLAVAKDIVAIKELWPGFHAEYSQVTRIFQQHLGIH